LEKAPEFINPKGGGAAGPPDRSGSPDPAATVWSGRRSSQYYYASKITFKAVGPHSMRHEIQTLQIPDSVRVLWVPQGV